MNTKLNKNDSFYTASFSALGRPCELYIETDNQAMVTKLAEMALVEATRIENKFSWSVKGSVCDRINHSNGIQMPIDTETHLLLSFAEQCFQISQGLFDISIGSLTACDTYQSGQLISSNERGQQPIIGFDKISLTHSTIVLPTSMRLDFGAIIHAYAADKIAQLMRDLGQGVPVLVNIGGDICVTGQRTNQELWQVGFSQPLKAEQTFYAVSFQDGAVATSAPRNYHLENEPLKLFHTSTGAPVNPPYKSLSVASDICLGASFIATLAMLKGEQADSFLKEQQVTYWCC